jgi:Type II secretion system (T2SS), protein G
VKFWTKTMFLLKSLLLFALNLIVETIPPRDLTVMRIGVTEIRIRSYWKANGQLPASLSDLPILEGRDNSTTDGWGRPIKYDVTGTTTATLSSMSADGTAGGTDLNADIIVAFDANKDE